TDHAESGRAVADGAIDLLALVEMGQEVVAVALEIVANEVRVVAVGDEADALGQEWVFDLGLFKPDRTVLARYLGESSDLVDQLALAEAPNCEGELRAERKAVENARQRETDQRRRERTAEDDDERVAIHEHAQIAAHQNERHEDDGSGEETEACCDIH